MVAERAGGPRKYWLRCDGLYGIPCFLHAGSQKVTVTPAADQLEVTADTTPVRAGKTVTFTASTEEAPFQVSRWIWVTADTAGKPRTKACTHTEAVCAVPVCEDGTMYAQAVVNGITEQAGAAVAVTDLALRLESVSGAWDVRPSKLGDNTLQLTVGVCDAAGSPVPGREVSLSLRVEEGSGAHDHKNEGTNS